MRPWQERVLPAAPRSPFIAAEEVAQMPERDGPGGGYSGRPSLPQRIRSLRMTQAAVFW